MARTKQEQQNQEQQECVVRNLVASGPGLWKYSHEGLAEKEAKGEGFFSAALERYGMREGDVVLVNAGNGNAFMVGV